ncbi:hypothetical protein Cpa01nite_18710 [Cellulomonas pakistanensis]|uniref:Uncharacterized protein n=2 Tax=Cellulomonas pakistanensis TaxID=992287 RepID=A0A919U6Q4_9CELL|nr:hypothetical protein Cpa01nite_18710 [Cellulomonas pakistanensis]
MGSNGLLGRTGEPGPDGTGPSPGRVADDPARTDPVRTAPVPVWEPSGSPPALPPGRQMVHGPRRTRRAAAPPDPGAAARREGSPLVLDLVFVVTVVALFALVGAVAAGVEKL